MTIGSERSERRRIVYFVRTSSLQFEARIARLFRVLTDRSCDCEVFAVVKARSGFDHDNKEYIATSDRIGWQPLKLVAKLIEVQWVGWRAYREHYRGADVLILANHEFLVLGLFLRLFGHAKVFVDLHEHYYEALFRRRWFSRWFFTRLFSGVIFANKLRAEDFLGQKSDYSRVVIARNLPDVRPGRVRTPAYTPCERLRIASVGSAAPGRFVRESVRALDRPEFAGRIDFVTFGPEVREPTAHIMVQEHGRFRHWEIDKLLEAIDASLVFYNPKMNGNFRLSEPNRFFQAFNLGKIIFCFHHDTLAEFYDPWCKIVDPENFATVLRKRVEDAILCKSVTLGKGRPTRTVTRTLARFSDGLENIELIRGARSRTSGSMSDLARASTREA